MTERILFVDDEPNILQAYQRTLRKKFTVVIAESGSRALEIIESEGPFPVVVSDMKMPGMDGATFLSIVKEKCPDTVRLMLTGNADQETAVSAINTSDVYRFLNKPCSAEEMTAAINSALEHHRLIKAEQELLENTVKGSIQAMVEILSIANPKIFGHASVIKNYMVKCAQKIGCSNTWELEAAGLLGQVGAVTLPETLLDKAMKGMPLSEDEMSAYQKHPEIGAELIEKIPRLEGISEIIRYQNKGFDGSGLPEGGAVGQDIPLGARILKPVMSLVESEAAGLSNDEIIARLKSNSGLYDPEVLKALEQVVASKGVKVVKNVSAVKLAEGMVIASDIVSVKGTLLVKKGQAISPSMIERLIQFCLSGLTLDEFSVYDQTVDSE